MIKDGSPVKAARKKSYVKPMISEVKLRPEEAVLGNCKISGAAGPISSSCSSPTQCNALAS
jgi:hypothetical protein